MYYINILFNFVIFSLTYATLNDKISKKYQYYVKFEYLHSIVVLKADASNSKMQSIVRYRSPCSALVVDTANWPKAVHT